MKHTEEEIQARIKQIAETHVNRFGSTNIGFAEESFSKREIYIEEGRAEWLRLASEAFAHQYAEDKLRGFAIAQLDFES